MKAPSRALRCLLLGTFFAWTPNLWAVTFTVTNVNDAGPGSLREALSLASAGDEIRFDASLAGAPIVLTSGELYLDKDLVLTGLGKELSILDGSLSSRVFDIAEGSNVTLSDLTVRNGWARECQADHRTRSEGGGIYNAGFLHLNRCTVTGNYANYKNSHCDDQGHDLPESTRGAGIFNRGTLILDESAIDGNFGLDDRAGFGAGIYNAGVAILNDSSISGNVAEWDRFLGTKGAGIYNDQSGTANLLRCQVNGNGGAKGIENAGSLTLTGTTIAGNGGWRGGGISNQGTLQITDSSVLGNSSGVGSWAGGILNYGFLTLQGTTVAGNNSEYGGGIVSRSQISGQDPDPTVMKAINSTIVNNEGYHMAGGISAGGSSTVISCTIAGNVTGTTSGGVSVAGFATFKSTIIAGNYNFNDPPQGDCGGTVTSLGHNVVGDTNTCIGFDGLKGDHTGVDWTLVVENGGSFQDRPIVKLLDNGGPTPTVALLPESPARDSIPTGECTDDQGNPVTTDQRGVSRPQGPACDAGAFEFSLPRGEGFWAHQCSDNGFKQVSPAALQAWFDEIREASSVFPECAPLDCEFLQPQTAQNDLRKRAQQQLLALWLNLASGNLTRERPVDLPSLTDATTLAEALSEIERVVCDELADHSDLGTAKDIAEALNGGSDDLELAATESAVTMPSGSTRSVSLGLINMSPDNRNYYLSVTGNWPAQLSTGRVTALGSLGVAPITLTVTAPVGPQTAVGSFRVVATEVNSPLITREVTIVFRIAAANPSKQQPIKSLRGIE
jgi:hypothetical protein